jgi:peptidoglycan-associated lipoprotein
MFVSAMLIAIFGLAILPAAGQNFGAGSSALDKIEFGLTYTVKSVKLSTTPGPYIALPGGSIDAVYNFSNKNVTRLGIAVDVNGESKDGLMPGVNLSQITVVAGPRCTLWQTKPGGLKTKLYGEVLGGYVHAFNSIFPTSSSVTSSANSFALQAGGGFNLGLSNKIGLRMFETDYILTKLPNNSNSYQHDIRVSAGLAFHF